ncbi:hypothetical protein OC846_004034 [Tilletia horrida]|uniref:Uncharacterized protein n=1 Tax=Tilletia horrida TaxID=155126 RepID=A0AAN6GNG9_9BASI|nr:hypothetical protein OC846_004034 [Tilletia horrida]
MVADGRGVQAAQQNGFDAAATGCDYYPGTDVPLHVWGIFWVHLNRVFELILLIFCILSEVNWGGLPERLFACTLPILSRSFGTTPLGLIQMILACSNLSHELGRFPLVTNWILFVIGILNVIAGAIFKAAGKNVRSFHPSRRTLVSSPPSAGGAKLSSSEGKMMREEGGGLGSLPFAHKGTGPRASVKGSLRQLRYVKEAATTGTFPAPDGHSQQQLQGVSVIGRPDEAFGGPARGGEGDMYYYYDPEAGKIRMPVPPPNTTTAAGAVSAGQSSSMGAGVPRRHVLSPLPPSFRTYDRNESARPSAGPNQGGSPFSLAKAVVTRADQLARSRSVQGGPAGPKASTPPSSVMQRDYGGSRADLDADLSNVSSQYHVRYGERGEGYGGHWRHGSGGSQSQTSLLSAGAMATMPPGFVPQQQQQMQMQQQQQQRVLHSIPEASRPGRPGRF